MSIVREVPRQLAFEFGAPFVVFDPTELVNVATNVVRVSFGTHRAAAQDKSSIASSEHATIVEQVLLSARMLGW